MLPVTSSISSQTTIGSAGAILLIDDDDTGTDVFAQVLSAEGFAVQTAPTGMRGVLIAIFGRYDLIVVDLRLPDMSGIDVLRALRRASVETPAVLATGFATVTATVEAMKLGAVDVIEKPFPADRLLSLLKGLGPAVQYRRPDLSTADLEHAALCRSVAQLLVSRPELSLEDTARSLGVERHTIERSVRLHTGRCFREWRRGLEMQHAAEILRLSEVPIKSVAYDLGYSSQRAFGRAFSAVNGMTPSEYRERHRSTADTRNG